MGRASANPRAVQPERGVSAFVLTQQWTGQDGDSNHQDRLRGEQELEIGSTVLHLTLKVFVAMDLNAHDRDSRESQEQGRTWSPPPQHLHPWRGTVLESSRSPATETASAASDGTISAMRPTTSTRSCCRRCLFLTVVDPIERKHDLPISRMENPWRNR